MVAVKPKSLKVIEKNPIKKLNKTKKKNEKSNHPLPKAFTERQKTKLVKDIEKETHVEMSTKRKVKYVYPSKAVNEDVVDRCLNALNKLNESYNTKNMIFGDENPIFMQIRSIKIQNSKGNLKFILPHSTVASTGEVCLITPDLKKGRKVDHEPTIDHWEELLRNAGVTSVKTVLPMRQLRVEYDQFELRRRLMTQHDFIMVDTRVLNHVSHLLGTMFFKKHNMIIPVKIDEKKDLKKNIDIGLRSVVLRLNEGEISTIVIGHTGMPQAHLKENILDLVKQFATRFPGGEANIRSLSLKLPLSMSLPLYLTLRSSNLIASPKLKKSIPKELRDYEDELSTIPGAVVKVRADGSVRVTKVQKEKSDAEEMDEDAAEEITQSSEDDEE